MTRLRSCVLFLAAALALAGCGGDPVDAPSTSAVTSRAPLQTFPAAARFDYQIGGAYQPAEGVRIVTRDRSAGGAANAYNICYLNAFQAQPGDLAWWQREHPSLLLRGANGQLVIDRGWNEGLLDIRTPDKRAAIAQIVGGWAADCVRSGYDAIEPDNLDSYTRSGGLLTADDALAYMTLLSTRVHGLGMLIGQKNAAELTPRVHAAGADFAVTEECQQFDECGSYTKVYGKKVIEIEYVASQFDAACRARRGQVSLVLRDRGVVARGRPGYLDRSC